MLDADPDDLSEHTRVHWWRQRLNSPVDRNRDISISPDIRDTW